MARRRSKEAANVNIAYTLIQFLGRYLSTFKPRFQEGFSVPIFAYT